MHLRVPLHEEVCPLEDPDIDDGCVDVEDALEADPSFDEPVVESRLPKGGEIEPGPLALGLDEVGMEEVGADQVSLLQLRLIQIGIMEIGPCQDRPPQIR